MNRTEWLIKRAKIAQERMDKLFALNYDEQWGEIEKPHQEIIENLIGRLPSNPHILDAACGTGKYWPILKENNCKIMGIDHSIEMLKNAQNKFPDIVVKKMKLQDIDFLNTFDAVICVDAMENIFPEDWPIIVKKFANAVKNNGFVYFTVELLEQDELQRNYEVSILDGIPVVLGEHIDKGGLGGYHYYPELQKVRDWIHSAELKIIEEREQEVYHHFLVKKTK